MKFGWNNILLFLFSPLTALNLICEIWTSSIILDRPLGSRGLGLHFELASEGGGGGGLGCTTYLGLASGPIGSFS